MNNEVILIKGIDEENKELVKQLLQIHTQCAILIEELIKINSQFLVLVSPHQITLATENDEEWEFEVKADSDDSKH